MATCPEKDMMHIENRLKESAASTQTVSATIQMHCIAGYFSSTTNMFFTPFLFHDNSVISGLEGNAE